MPGRGPDCFGGRDRRNRPPTPRTRRGPETRRASAIGERIRTCSEASGGRRRSSRDPRRSRRIRTDTENVHLRSCIASAVRIMFTEQIPASFSRTPAHASRSLFSEPEMALPRCGGKLSKRSTSLGVRTNFRRHPGPCHAMRHAHPHPDSDSDGRINAPTMPLIRLGNALGYGTSVYGVGSRFVVVEDAVDPLRDEEPSAIEALPRTAQTRDHAWRLGRHTAAAGPLRWLGVFRVCPTPASTSHAARSGRSERSLPNVPVPTESSSDAAIPGRDAGDPRSAIRPGSRSRVRSAASHAAARTSPPAPPVAAAPRTTSPVGTSLLPGVSSCR